MQRLAHSFIVFYFWNSTQAGQEQNSSQVEWVDSLGGRSLLCLSVSPSSPSIPLLSRQRASSSCLSVSGLITHTGSQSHHDLNPSLPFPLCNPFITGEEREERRGERERVCCSKSPLPRFCCVYYAICFRALIGVLAEQEGTECV